MKSGETRKFIKRPKNGNIVKVYTGDHTYKFGIVIGIDTLFDEVDGELIEREILILKESGREYELIEIDYFLEKKRIRFKNIEGINN